MLARTLADVRARIAKRSKLNENDTKATLIEPVLHALGWDVHDVEEVAREHRAPRGKPVDYALLVMREPQLYLEAKALGENLDDGRFAEQIMTYAVLAGVEWTVLTDGNEWRVYNSHAKVPIAEKLLRTVRISDSASAAEEILNLLSKEQLRTKQIDAMWRAQFVDRKVKTAIERLFNPDHDMALVNHVAGLAKDLTAEEIRGSMRRCTMTLDFPLSPSQIARTSRTARVNPKATGSKKALTVAPIRSDWKKVLGFEPKTKHLIEAGIINPPLKLVHGAKESQLEATLQRNGTVLFQGKAYPSLSQAGCVARASVSGLGTDGKMRPVNGWDYWRYRRADGSTASIDGLRMQFVERQLGGRAKEG